MRVKLLILGAAAVAAPAVAEPERLAAPGGEVVLASDADKKAHADYSYAAVRRAGDVLYLSGVVARRLPGEGTDAEAFKVQLRRAFDRLGASLEAAGASFADVTLVNSFHVWQGPNFTGDKTAHMAAFLAVKNEYMKPPHAAWTAVGTSGLVGEGGLVEIQLIAHAPKRRPR